MHDGRPSAVDLVKIPGTGHCFAGAMSDFLSSRALTRIMLCAGALLAATTLFLLITHT